MFQCRLDLQAELRTEVVLPLQVRQWQLQLQARGIMVSQPWGPLHICTKAATRGDPFLLLDKEFPLTDTVTRDIIKDRGQDTGRDPVTDRMGVPETAPRVVQAGLRASIPVTHKDSTLHRVGMDLLRT